MRRAICWVLAWVLALAVACHPRPAARRIARGEGDTTYARILPMHQDSTDSLVRKPRVVADRAVVVFWLAAADTIDADDRSTAFDDLRYYTAQVSGALAANHIRLIATRSDTLYVTLPNNQRRTILLSGLDYPYGYVLVDPGGPERILTGVYSDDDLLDELRAYFDLSDDTLPDAPRAVT